MKTVHLPEDYALVLQQVEEIGEEEFDTLAETMRFDRKRLTHIVQALRHKGLIVMSQRGRSEPWIRLSSKGRQLMQYLWPESSAPGMAA